MASLFCYPSYYNFEYVKQVQRCALRLCQKQKELMKKKAWNVLLITSVLLTAVVSCKKDKDDAAEQTVDLKPLSIAAVKDSIRGEWQVHYAYGGFTGHSKQEFTRYFIRFMPNDSIYIWFGTGPGSTTKAVYEQKQTIFGYTATVVSSETPDAIQHSWVVDHKKGDTLILKDNHPDGWTYFMTKTPPVWLD